MLRVRVHGPSVAIVQQRTRGGSMNADPADRGPEATPQGASVSSDRYVVDHITVLMWRPCLCSLQPVDAVDSAVFRSGTPHNYLLAASNHLGMAGARVSGNDDHGRGSRSADPSRFLGQVRSRWPSQRPLRERRRRAWRASFGHRNPIAYVALDRWPVRRNERLLRPAPHNWLGHIRTVMWSTT